MRRANPTPTHTDKCRPYRRRREAAPRGGGRRGLQVELAPADLVALTDATVAPIAR